MPILRELWEAIRDASLGEAVGILAIAAIWLGWWVATP